MGPRVSANGAQLTTTDSKQDYGTPPELLAAVQGRFGRITVDLAAHVGNAVCPTFFAPPDRPEGAAAIDSLAQDWSKLEGLLWLNPPFSGVRPWVEKCVMESARGARIALLTAASVGSNWFRDCCAQHAQVLFLNRRIRFVGADQVFPKDCMISIFGIDDRRPRVWDPMSGMSWIVGGEK